MRSILLSLLACALSQVCLLGGPVPSQPAPQTDLHSPGPVGDVTPGTGAFTNATINTIFSDAGGSLTFRRSDTTRIGQLNSSGWLGVYKLFAGGPDYTGAFLDSSGLNLLDANYIKWGSDVTLIRDAANTLAQRNGSAEQEFRLGPVGSYAGIRSNGGELDAFDFAGNVTLISPHALDAPDSLYDADEPYPRVLREANVFLGIVRYTNQTRQLAGRSDAVFTETFDEHNSRLGLKGELALTKLDWDAVQLQQQVNRNAERAEWAVRKKAAESEKTPFTEAEPAPYTLKPAPAFIANATTRKTALDARRAKVSQLRTQAFSQLKSDLSTVLGVEITSPDDLVGKADDILVAAKAKRTGTAAQQIATMQQQNDVLYRLIVMLMRSKGADQ